MKRLVLYCAVLALAFGITSPSMASFTGHNVTLDWVYPDLGGIFSTDNAVVGAGVEFTSVGGHAGLDIDIGDNTETIVLNTGVTEFQDTAFNGFRLSDTNNTIADIVGFSIGEITGNVVGFDASDLSFNSGAVLANFSAVTFEQGSTVRLDVEFAESIPEPGTLLLLCTGIAGLAGYGIRRRKKA